MTYQIGDIVNVKNQIHVSKENSKRTLYTLNSEWFTPIKGIVIGYSFMFEGTLVSDIENGISWLKDEKPHEVIVVAPITRGNRYNKPIRVFEKDIELIDKE